MRLNIQNKCWSGQQWTCHDLNTFNWFLISSTGCVVAPGAAMKRLASNAFVLQVKKKNSMQKQQQKQWSTEADFVYNQLTVGLVSITVKVHATLDANNKQSYSSQLTNLTFFIQLIQPSPSVQCKMNAAGF